MDVHRYVQYQGSRYETTVQWLRSVTNAAASQVGNTRATPVLAVFLRAYVASKSVDDPAP